MKLLTFYGVDAEEQDELLALARGGRRVQWWREFNAYLNPSFSQYVALESEARVVREYQNSLPPGILQTEDYARAVIANGWSGYGIEQEDALVEVRMLRRKKLLGNPGLRFHALIGESMRLIDTGGPEVMRRQFGQLVEDAAHPSVTIQVVPLSAGRRGVVSSGISILEFPDDEPMLGFMESGGNTLMQNSPRESKRCVRIFEHLLTTALSPDASLELIKTWMD